MAAWGSAADRCTAWNRLETHPDLLSAGGFRRPVGDGAVVVREPIALEDAAAVVLEAQAVPAGVDRPVVKRGQVMPAVDPQQVAVGEAVVADIVGRPQQSSDLGSADRRRANRLGTASVAH